MPLVSIKSKYVRFIRSDGCTTKRGEMVGSLKDTFPASSASFIVCKVAEGVITSGNVTLKLDQLSADSKYIPEPTTWIDENEKEQVKVLPNYFSENGVSVLDCPVITEGDLIYG